jgi:molybdopterin molybdotransferase
MLTESAALNLLLNHPHTAPKPHFSSPLHLALNLVSAKSAFARLALPSFDNSMMDGYAVAATELHPNQTFTVIDEQPAGISKSLSLLPHQAIRIFTGAPLPLNTTAVIMQEDVTRTDSTITLNESYQIGENMRLKGADLCVGQQILYPNDIITPGKMALMASQGITELSTYPTPKIAILSTGSELVPLNTPNQLLLPGQIYNSNSLMLDALLKKYHFSKNTLHHVEDNLSKTISMLQSLLIDHDLILLSGGVSVGDHDFIKPALLECHFNLELWKIKIKPGKPFLFATRDDGKVVFGLPGNPVSSYITFLTLVLPTLKRIAGHASFKLPQQQATLSCEITNSGDRPHYLRGHVQQDIFTPQGLQMSHALYTLSQANALLRVEANTSFQANTICSILLI